MNEHVLHGCTPTPLASYLKGLAVLRLVAEQAGEPEATGCWRDDTFVLRTRLSRDELVEYFLERYEPTPLVAPWNGGSGFYFQEGKLKEKDPITGKRLKTGVRDQPTEGTRILEAFEKSSAPRFSPYRAAIAFARATIRQFGLVQAPLNTPVRLKDAFIARLRGSAPREILGWFDAALVIADREPSYPPLLGTGGNDGNLDFTNNFMQRLADVFAVTTGDSNSTARAMLEGALVGAPTTSLSDCAIGQFAPGSAGGPNATSGFDGAAQVNPWDFILMLEGAVLLAASAARRLESTSRAVLAAPFTVRSRAATVGSAAASDDADARGEIWMPLWPKPITLDELTVLFSEGRAALGARSAQDGLDFARAVARLGVDRGIHAFQRFGLLMRSGKAFLATPITRVPVRRNPQGDLIDDLDRGDWLARVQRAGRDENLPQAFRSVVSRLDASLFAMVRRTDRNAVEATLRLLARMEATASASPKIRDQIRPVPQLSDGWRRAAEDGSSELRIALALARLALPADGSGKRGSIGLRLHLAPLSLDGSRWDAESRLVAWGPGKIDRNLAQLLHRRRLEAVRVGWQGEVLASRAGASLGDIDRFVRGETNDRRIAELAHGLACVELAPFDAASAPVGAPIALPPAYSLLRPLFSSNAMLHRLGWLPADRSLHLPAEIPARLAADDVAVALRLGWQRLRALGVRLPGREPPAHPRCGDGPRLLAALMIPLTFGETRRLMNWVGLDPEQPSASPMEPVPETTD